WVGVIFSSLFSFVAIYLTATESMNIYDVLMLATGTVSLYVYLAIAISQLKLRKKLEAEGQNIPFKMWLFPWLTYLVIIFIVGALITMIIEGTYFKEVVYTSVLALFIVGLG
ncbi:GABA permease, partial [Klebsiella pneumoniae]|nr:GABA permease [Klebsiella pneumoniae]